MKHLNNILFIVQARLGSQRIPQKMIRNFAGTTLVDIILRKVSLSIIPQENFFFSVYEPELVKIGNSHGVQIFHRSEKSAKSEGVPLTDIYEWHTLPYKWVVLISGCNPLLQVATINRFIEHFIKSPYDSLFAVISKKTYFWGADGKCINPPSMIMNTKEVSPIFEAAHCLYASPLKSISEGVWLGDFSKNNPELFIMPALEAWDIDEEWEFKVGEKLYEARNNLL